VRQRGRGGALQARGDRLFEFDRFEDGLGIVVDGRRGDLLDMVRGDGLVNGATLSAL
jgi:hypothetical protein